MESGVIAKGQILSESNGQRWIVGSFLNGVNGIIESYEAASYSDKTPTEYPVILQIVPYGDEPWPIGFQFYLDHAKPDDLGNWKRKRHARHLGIPVLLGEGSYKINDQNYKFIVLERHGKDLWSLFLDHNKKFEAHTAYKISLQIINVLKYIHSKSYVHGDIRASNIVFDVATQNHIYLMIGHSASYTVSDHQVDSNKNHEGAAVLLSRDAHMGVLTERGDMEMLFYNLIRWLGLELPWAKNSIDPSLVLEEKNKVFANVQSWSEEMALPAPVRQFMELLATMETNDEPMYNKFKDILENGLRKLYHVPYGNLEFSISSIPIIEQIEEDPNQENKQQRRYKKKTCIPKLKCSVAVLAKIISENCRHEGEVRLRDAGPGSLIEIICALAYKKKNNFEWQNKLANAWDRDTADLKTMTRRLWRKKGLQAKVATTEEAPIENQHEEPSQGSTATAAASAQENTNGLNYSNLGASDSQNRSDAISSDGIPPQEHAESFHLSNISPPMVRLPARSPSLFRWNGVQSSPIGPSTSGYSSRGSNQGDSHSEAMAFSRTPEHFYDTEHSRTPEVAAVKVKREAGEEVTECLRTESADYESWQDKYEMLNTWLEMKKEYLDVFGSIPSEPQVMTERVQKMRVLLDEFRTQNLRLRQLKKVLATLPPDSADALRLEQMEHRWWNIQDRLEEIGRQLGEASIDQSLDALQDVSNSLDKLSLGNDTVDQQLRKVAILAEHLENLHQTVLANASTVAEQLCQALSRQAFTSGIRVKLRSVKTFYSNLQQQIRVKRAQIEGSLSDCRQFDEMCEGTRAWLVKELENVLEKPLISTDRAILQQQHNHYELKYQCILGKETKVMEILERGRELTRPHNVLNWIKSQWNRLIKQNLGVTNKLKICVESCDKFYEKQDGFLCWLSEVESKLESAKPYSLDDISKQLEELSALQIEVLEKSGEFEECTNLGHKFISVCDEDKNNKVENELIEMKNRWVKLNNGLLKRIQLLKDSDRHLAEFHKNLSELTDKLKQHDNELASHDRLEIGAKDLNRVKALEKAMTYLQKSIDAVHQQAKDLVREVNELGIDTDSLFKLVNRVSVHIQNSKAKVAKIREEILEHKRARAVRGKEKNNSAKSNAKVKIERPRTPVEIITIESSDEEEDNVTAAAAKQFYEKQELFLRWLSQIESKLESVKPASLDDIGEQLKELSGLRNEVNEKSSQFEECTNFGHKYIGACDGAKINVVKNELIDMKHRWDKLNNGMLKRTQLLKDSERHLAEFHKSLSELTCKLERYVHELASHDRLEVGAKDLNRVEILEKEMTCLQRPLDAVHQQAEDLVHEANELGIDANSLFKLVNRVVVHIEDSKAKLIKTRKEILEHERARTAKETEERKSAKGNVKVKIEQSPVEVITLESSEEDEDDVNVAVAKQFHEAQELFLRWLSQAESKLETVKSASLDDIGKQLKVLHELRDEVREKLGEFEQYKTLSHTFIGICDVNRRDIVKNELDAAKDRWTKLNHDVLNRLHSFEDMDKHYADFNKSLLDLQQKIGPYEKESASHDTLEATAKDSKLLLRVRDLEKQMTSLQKPLDAVRQQADGLLLKACEQGINVNNLWGEVNLAAARIENCKTKFDETRNDILKQEHARLLKEILADTPTESDNSSKAHSVKRQDRDSKSKSPSLNEEKSESPPRKRRSQSKDSVSSLAKSTKNNDGSKSYKNDKRDDSRSNSDLSLSKPKSSICNKVADNSNRNSYSSRYDKSRLDTSYSRNRGIYYDRYGTPLTSSDQYRPWQKPYFPWRPQPWQEYRSNTFRTYGDQNMPHYDSRFGRDDYHRTSQSPGRNQRYYLHQDRPFRHLNRENNSYRKVTSAPDRTHGWEPRAVKELEQPKEQDANSDEQLRKGENTENQLEGNSQKVNKPLVNYSSDEDSEREQCAVKKEKI